MMHMFSFGRDQMCYHAKGITFADFEKLTKPIQQLTAVVHNSSRLRKSPPS